MLARCLINGSTALLERPLMRTKIRKPLARCMRRAPSPLRRRLSGQTAGLAYLLRQIGGGQLKISARHTLLQRVEAWAAKPLELRFDEWRATKRVEIVDPGRDAQCCSRWMSERLVSSEVVGPL